MQGLYDYDPYGNVLHSIGAITDNPFGFAGQYTDSDTGLIYMRARFYDPHTAQFISRDPLSDSTGAPYAYADDNPVNVVDPSGLCGTDSLVDVLDCANPFSSDNIAYQAANAAANLVGDFGEAVGEAAAGLYDEFGQFVIDNLPELATAGVCLVGGPGVCVYAMAALWGYNTGTNIAAVIDGRMSLGDAIAQEGVDTMLAGLGGGFGMWSQITERLAGATPEAQRMFFSFWISVDSSFQIGLKNAWESADDFPQNPCPPL